MAKSPTKNDSFEAPIPPALHGTLAALVLASHSPTGFLILPEADAQPFVDAGFIDLWKDDNGQVLVEDGNVKARATASGIEYSTANPAVPNGDYEHGGQSTGRKVTFKRPTNIEIDKGVALPKGRRGRADGPAYPFDSLEIGDSFHIAATEDSPDPAKSVASSVSTANIRYSEEVPGETQKARKKNKDTGQFEYVDVPKRKALRRFVSATVDASDPKGAGVRVWRDEVADDEDADQDETTED